VERDDALPCRTFEQVVHATFNALAQDAGADFRPREGNVVLSIFSFPAAVPAAWSLEGRKRCRVKGADLLF